MVRRTTKPSANHLRAWREKAQLSQDDLAKLVNTKGNVIGALEAGERGLSDKWLRRLAPHLGTTPGFLLDHHPDDVDERFLEDVINARKENRKAVEAFLQAMRTGTDR